DVGRLLPLGFLAAAITATRYESVALLAVAAGVCVAQGQRRAAAWVAVAAALPIVGMGLVSIAHGASFLPTAVWLNGNLGGFRDPPRLGRSAWVCMARRFFIVPALLIALVVLALRRGRARRAADERVCTPLFAAAVLALQAQFGAVGWFYRYEAYCVVL